MEVDRRPVPPRTALGIGPTPDRPGARSFSNAGALQVCGRFPTVTNRAGGRLFSIHGRHRQVRCRSLAGAGRAGARSFAGRRGNDACAVVFHRGPMRGSAGRLAPGVRRKVARLFSRRSALGRSATICRPGRGWWVRGCFPARREAGVDLERQAERSESRRGHDSLASPWLAWSTLRNASASSGEAACQRPCLRLRSMASRL